MPRTRRSVTAGTLFVAGLLLLFVPMALAASVDPVQVGGKGDPQNPRCSDFGLDPITKFDPVESGTQDGVTLTKVDDHSIDWSSTVEVGAVIVKGGPGANVYFYDGATADTGLVTPTNPKNGKPYGLSHVDFCAPGETEPSGSPSETVEPSETPTDEPSVEPTQTTREEEEDDTEVLGGRLARTGVGTWVLAVIGSGFMGSGIALRAAPRRKRRP